MSEKFQLLENIANTLDSLIDRQPERTKFFTVFTPASLNPVQLGRGACRAVATNRNAFVLNTTTSTAANLTVGYIGDADAQYWQAFGQPLFPIPCRDLSEIWIRGIGVAQPVQVMVLLGRKDEIEINRDLYNYEIR